MKLLKWSIAIGAAVFALVLLSGVLSSGSNRAFADPEPTAVATSVVTEAEVLGGGGAVPVVDAKWELPDMQIYTPGFQYCAASGPTDYNCNEICDADDDPLTTGMQMYPILCDDPNNPATQRKIEYWFIAEDETGLADIISTFDKVFQPGTDSGEAYCPEPANPPYTPPGAPLAPTGYCFKYQPELEVVSCDLIGFWDDTVSDPEVVFAPAMLAAIDTGQIDEETAETLVKRCTKGEVLVAMTELTIATHEPAGTYIVEANAQDHNSNVGTLQNTFEVLPIIGLDIDFSIVDWGSISAGIRDVVSGDQDLSTSLLPTIKDCGNIDMAISLEYSPMVQQGVPGPKTITTFDAKLLGENLLFAADVPQCFSNCLIPCHPRQLDLSIDPPATLPPGIYLGHLDIVGTACGLCEP